MSGYSGLLFQISHIEQILHAVLNKMSGKSFVRLRRSCREMHHYIEKNYVRLQNRIHVRRIAFEGNREETDWKRTVVVTSNKMNNYRMPSSFLITDLLRVHVQEIELPAFHRLPIICETLTAFCGRISVHELKCSITSLADLQLVLSSLNPRYLVAGWVETYQVISMETVKSVKTWLEMEVERKDHHLRRISIDGLQWEDPEEVQSGDESFYSEYTLSDCSRISHETSKQSDISFVE